MLCSWCGLEVVRDGGLGMCWECRELMETTLSAEMCVMDWVRTAVADAPDHILESMAAGLSGDELQLAARKEAKRRGAR